MKIKIIFFLLPLFIFAQKKEKSLSKKITKEISVEYVLQFPDDYKKSKHDWPLIVFLHGSGERGDDLSKISIHGPLKYVENGNKLDAVVLAPQCPEKQVWDRDVLTTLIKEVVLKYRINFTRVYLTGLSMGGYGTWELALKQPEMFAAVAPICGRINYTFLENAKNLKDMPIWVFHGAKDEVVPVINSERMVKALKNTGANPKFTIFPEAGHDSWSKPYSNPDFYTWLLSQEQKLVKKR
ncbi:MAG: prolyl oligopeptidase family serine peptidase [Flavobacteriaceae bacterium]|nr:prolyl oligopeptidase family serine peptidase [Flavobacteriaceae bacterium]